jgi:predicted nuclease of predicted toxin-antitoxin system
LHDKAARGREHPAQFVEQLRSPGHDVVYAAELKPGLDDDSWLAIARTDERILITDDKDFGELVFRRRLLASGVVLLRQHRMTLDERLRWLATAWPRILSQPPGSFIVVAHRRIRVRSANTPT